MRCRRLGTDRFRLGPWSARSLDPDPAGRLLDSCPQLVDAEVGSVLRRIVLRGELDADVAATRLGQARALVDVRHPMNGRLSSDAWRLREEITFYEALYVSLAAALGRSLVTSDGRLAAAARRHCEILLMA